MSESEETNEVVELLRSARNDIANKNFAAAVAAISAALDELETTDFRFPPSRE